MAIIVRKTRGAGPTRIDLATFFVGSNRRAIEPAIKRKKRQIASSATLHYRNALSEVGHVLSSGQHLRGTGGGARIIRFRDGAGKSRRLRTGAWPALTAGYRNRDPKSSRIWNKRGQLSKFYRQDVHPKSAKAFIVKSTSRPASRSNRLRVTMVVGFSSLPNNTVETLIAETFVNGSSGPAQGFKARGLNRKSSELIGYPEAARRVFRNRGRSSTLKSELRLSLGKPVNRPFVAQLSGRLGREMHKALRRL